MNKKLLIAIFLLTNILIFNANAERTTIYPALHNMSIEEKVCQMFVVEPTAIIPAQYLYTRGSATLKALDQYPVGGLVFFDRHLKGQQTVKEGIAFYQEVMRAGGRPILFICSDEEGGSVSRVVRRYGESVFPSAKVVGETGIQAAEESGIVAGRTLKSMGFNVNFAPVVDVALPGSRPLGNRTYSSNPYTVSEMSVAFVEAMRPFGVAAAAKHFPGIGGIQADTHQRAARSDATLEELSETNLLPFLNLINADIQMVMVGHALYAQIDAANPATLSPAIVTGLLRQKLGFSGVIISDALNMKAISKDYSSKQAAVLAIKAGCDILLLPNNFKNAYQGVLDAVNRGEISEQRVDESVQRILALKHWLEEGSP